MGSPFPGMDPYLEAHWGDIHHRLITYACDQLQGHLPKDLLARVEERVFVETPKGVERSIVPDLRVVGRSNAKPSGAVASQPAATDALVINLEEEPVTQGYIEIVDVSSGRSVVTVIEFLSLANKTPGPGQDLYKKKQQELRDGRVSLVEIDLLRSGQHVLAVPAWKIPAARRTTYQASVLRAWKPIEAEYYPIPLASRLPIIRVPLRQSDPDAPLDLQPLIEQCYRNGAYDADLDYRKAPVPPLAVEDGAWASELLKSRDVR